MPDIFTVEEVAEKMNCSRRTIINLIERGRFPGAYKLDPKSLRSTWRIPAADLNQYMAEQQTHEKSKA